MNKVVGIYKITNPKNRVYIGQSVDVYSRISKYKNLNCKSQPKLYRSLKKYGFENHKIDVVSICDLSELNDQERYYQELYNAVETGMNCMFQRTEDKKQRMSEETKLKISKVSKGRKFSDVTRKRISDALKGKNKSKDHVAKISKSQKGKNRKPHAKETRIKLSKNSGNSRVVLDTSTGVYYNSVTELSKIIDVKFSTLNARLSGQNINNTNYLLV